MATEQIGRRGPFAAPTDDSTPAVLLEEHSLVAASRKSCIGSAALGERLARVRRSPLPLWAARTLLLIAFGALVLTPRVSHAFIGLSDPNNNVPDPSWIDEENDPDDPGWNNIATGFRSYTYIGDGWVITAQHVGATTVTFPGQTFEPIPNQVYTVLNPTDWAVPLSTNSDLMLFRIDGDPGLPSLTIASEPPPLGGEVVFIGRGRGGSSTEYHWNVNTSDPDNWIWTEVASGGNYHGYKSAGSLTRRWGTNAIVSDEPFFDEDADPQYNVDNDADLNHVFTLSNRNVISLITTFEESGGTSHESQAIGGDSGSAVFYNRNGSWELSGVVNATFIYPNQPTNWAVYGDATAFSDLSVYRDEIYDIINANAAYSVMGDVNLDGVVSGDGTGTSATDDITAFIEGWRYEQGAHSVESWKKGDLSLDGKTDLADFLLMRNALLGSGSGAGAAALASLLGVTVSVVPEPSSAALLLIGAMFMFGMAKRRSRVAAL